MKLETIKRVIQSVSRNRLLFFLASLHLLIRAVLITQRPERLPLSEFPNRAIYLNALNNHFASYILNTSLLPPLNYVLDAIPVWILGPTAAHALDANLWMLAILNGLAVIMLYRACLHCNCNRYIAFTTGILYTLALIPFEFWRNGTHYDQLTIFFASFFAYSLIRHLNNADNRNGWLPAIAGALLILQSSVNTCIVPFVIILATVADVLPWHNWKKFLRSLGLSLSLPLVAILLLTTKNYANARILSPSTKGGPALMMVVTAVFRDTLNEPRAEMRKFVHNCNPPQWYLHAFNNPVPPPLEDPVSRTIWDDLAPAFCFCMPWGTREAGTYPFVFQPLHNYLAGNNYHKIAKIVSRDMADVRHRPYLFAGSSPELSPRWIGIYGKESSMIALKLFLSKPWAYLSQASRLHYKYAYESPSFLETITWRFKQGDRNRFLPFSGFHQAVARIYSKLARTSYRACFYAAPVMFLLIILSCQLRNELDGLACFLRTTGNSFLLLFAVILLNAGVFSFAVGGENDRYFMQSTPYLLITVNLTVTAIIQMFTFLKQNRSKYPDHHSRT